MGDMNRAERRRLLASESGTVFKDPGGRLNICLVYPNTYHVGMSNLGFTGIYTLLNRRDDVVCERAFVPDRKDWYVSGRQKHLLSLESGRPLSAFDIIGFSVSFENDYPNVVRMLHAARIGPTRAERGNGGPLVIMGGPCAFMNPEPLADFMDLVFVGEAEEMIDEFVDAVGKAGGKKDLFSLLARKRGFYIPAYYEPVYAPFAGLAGVRKKEESAPDRVRRRYVRNLDRIVLSSVIRANATEFGGMHLVEAMRGCPFSCRFCAAGHIYNPPRHREADVLSKEVAEARRHGLRVGLIAPSLTEYRDLRTVLAHEGVHFSITSLRASRTSAALLDLLRDRKSVSIAPEAGSQRLRKIIDKKISEEDILLTAQHILASGVRTLRLYFMVGLPTETDDDARAIVDLARKIRRGSGRGVISLTLSTFVPKPFTPFQWHAMADMRTVKRRVLAVKKGLASGNFRVKSDVIKDAYLQGLLAMGDRRLGQVLLRMVDEQDWGKACAEAGIDPGYYLFRCRGFEEALPWDVIDSGVEKRSLWDQYQRALTDR